jgi:hypothetical protein
LPRTLCLNLWSKTPTLPFSRESKKQQKQKKQYHTPSHC